jgi:hypothetical protein
LFAGGGQKIIAFCDDFANFSPLEEENFVAAVTTSREEYSPDARSNPRWTL